MSKIKSGSDEFLANSLSSSFILRLRSGFPLIPAFGNAIQFGTYLLILSVEKTIDRLILQNCLRFSLISTLPPKIADFI